MKAVLLKEPGHYSIEDVRDPVCPEDGLLVKVLACGLCGTDLRTLRSGHRNIKYPWIIGHEVCGEVVEKGKACDSDFEIGDILAIAPMIYCGKCDFCMEERYELCDNQKELAQHYNGGFAEYMAVPGEALRLGTIAKKPDELSEIEAAVAEPVSSCINAQEKAGIKQGEAVLIIGSGPIGCIHTALAKAGGAKVIVADISESRLNKAKQFGADILIDTSKTDIVKKLYELTQGRGADVVITANSVAKTQVQAVEVARKGGRVVLFGGLPHNDSKPGIDTNIIHYKALNVLGTSTYAPRHYEKSLQLGVDKKMPFNKLVTHVLPLKDFNKGVELVSRGEALKVVYVP